LTHFTAVLRGEDAATLASRDVRLAWSAYLELVVEPAGWRAVLVPSPDTAELLNTEADRRGSLVVEVVDVTCDSLEAEVEIITGAPELEGKLATVPVDELYPLNDQEIPSLNMTPTVVALDLIRFFYKNLWMPWDEDSDCCDWVSEHLENRLSLHFSLVSGSGDQATAIKLDQLVARAELNRTALTELEDMASVAEESQGELSMSYQMLGRMYELHQDQDSIRREAEMLENPTLRLAVEAKTTSSRKKSRKDVTAGVLLVWAGGSLSSLSSLLNTLEAEFGASVPITTYPDLQHAVDCSVAGDAIILARPGQHQLRSLGGLTSGGRIMSRGCPEASVTLTPGDTENIFLGLEQGTLEISDIRIDCKNVHIGLMVHAGELLMTNVTLLGGSTTVLVGSGARLKMTNTKITDAGIGVELSPGAIGCVVNCVVDRNRVGLSVGDGGKLNVRSSYVGKNEEYGVVVQCSKRCEAEGVWSGEQGVAKAAVKGVILETSEIGSNGIGDVAILELEGLLSPCLDRRSHLTRRFSTPMSGKSVNQGPESRDSPILPSLSRVLTYQD